MADLDRVLPRLRSQMTRAQLVLFIGAGFSLGARDRKGRNLPTSTELRDALLAIAYPGEALDPDGALGDAFAVALARNRRATQALFEERLSVNPDSLPDYYAEYFRMPWHRVYTLNIDDFESAAARKFTLRRKPLSLSATTAAAADAPPGRSSQQLEVVHLNGMLGDPPRHWTFAEHQYAERLAGPESWYSRCAADVRGRPVVYIGTELRESALWQHVELRRRQRIESELLPPGSILVSPSLPRTRRDMLAPFNVEWIEGTAESFAAVLALIREDAERGFVFLQTYDEHYGRPGIPLVSELASERPTLETEYLSGDEPQWSDLLSGRATTRSNDSALLAIAQAVLSNAAPQSAIAVTGTAGAGKSTALMRVALELSHQGLPVLWVGPRLKRGADDYSKTRERNGGTHRCCN